MRVLLGLLAAIAVIAGAAFGVGYFLLPNTLDVSRSLLIERPRATVYAQIGDLRQVKEWSPYFALDPEAQWTFEGEAGPGQIMRWSSDVARVGAGDMRIVAARPNETVDLLIRAGEGESFDSQIVVRPAQRGANVTWLVRAQCAPGAMMVPCRYANLMLQRSIGEDLQTGLTRLKAMTEDLSDVDFEGLQPDFVTLPGQPFLYVEATIVKDQPTAEDMQEADAGSVAQLRAFLRDAQPALSTSGPLHRLIAVWEPQNARYVFRLGYPFAGPAPLTLVGVQVGRTPSGRHMRVLHVGMRADLRATYARAYAYMEAHHIAARGDGLPWEVVLQSDAPTPPAATSTPLRADQLPDAPPAPPPGSGPVRIEVYFPIE